MRFCLLSCFSTIRMILMRLPKWYYVTLLLRNSMRTYLSASFHAPHYSPKIFLCFARIVDENFHSFFIVVKWGGKRKLFWHIYALLFCWLAMVWGREKGKIKISVACRRNFILSFLILANFQFYAKWIFNLNMGMAYVGEKLKITWILFYFIFARYCGAF